MKEIFLYFRSYNFTFVGLIYLRLIGMAVTAADDGLKAQITEQYNNTIAWIRSLKEAQGALEPRCA